MLNLKSFWNSINFLFLSLCLTQFHGFGNKKKRFYQYYFFSFTLLKFVLVTYLIYRGIFHLADINEKSPEVSYIMNIDSIVVFVKYLTTLIITAETWFNRAAELKMFLSFDLLAKKLLQKFKLQKNYYIFHKRLRILMFLSLAYSLTYYLVRFSYNIPGSLTTNLKEYNLMFILTTLIIRIRCIQVMILEKFLVDDVEFLKQIVERSKAHRTSRKNEVFIGYLNEMQIIYLKCWRITRYIDQCYGWSLVAMVLQCIVDFTMGSYRIYVNWNEPNSAAVIIGKFCDNQEHRQSLK